MAAVFKKDFFSLFHGLIGWIFIAVLWCLMSLYIGIYCFLGLDPDIADVLALSATLLMILLPILCMRSFADERRLKTDQMILTAPVTVGAFVMGKFLALASVYSIVVLGLCAYPVILSRFGTVPFAESYTGLLGMWLFGLAEIAVCMFLSGLTESAVIAAVLSFAALFLALIIPNLQSMISSEGNVLTAALGVLNIPGRFDTFLNGRLDLTAVVYLVSCILLFLFLTAQVIQKRRYQVSRASMSFGVYSCALIAVMLVIVLVANLAVNRLPSAMTSLDVTAGGLYSLTDETKDYLSGLEEDVTIYVMTGESDKDETLDSTLQSMSALSDRLTVTYVDPAANPSFLQEYSEVMDASWNSLVVESDERYTVVDHTDIYEYSIDYTTYTSQLTGYDAEGQIDSAIAYVTSRVLPKVYVLTGHGETALGAAFTEVLRKLNCEGEELDLLANDAVPEDCEALVINAPVSDLSDDDTAKILAYLEDGGDLIAVTNYEVSPADLPNYCRVLAYYGVSVSEGVVLENNQGYYYNYASYLLPDVTYEEETSGVTNGYVFAAYSQALYTGKTTAAEDADEAEDGTAPTYTGLLTTSDSAYIHEGVSDVDDDLSMTGGEETGTCVIGLKVQADGSKAYIFGSFMIFTDSADQMVSGSNSAMFSGIVNACVDTEGVGKQISVAAKSVSGTLLTIPAFTSAVLCLVFVVFIPVVLLSFGCITWALRRRR